MAVTKTIIQNSNTRTVVKIVGTASGDTSIISLASDLPASGQTTATPKANITKVWYSVAGTGDATVVRNSVTALKLFGSDVIDCFGLAENNGSDIVVTFTNSAGGTVILECSKISGYSSMLPDVTGT